jgi:hypothetical protein
MTTTTDRIEAEPAHAPEPIVFTRARGLVSFDAEYAIAEGDLIVHFYPGARGQRGSWWTQRFPAALEAVATTYFQAGPPRLRAAHIQDFGIDSWWLRARGFGLVLDPDALVRGFLGQLERALDELQP